MAAIEHQEESDQQDKDQTMQYHSSESIVSESDRISATTGTLSAPLFRAPATQAPKEGGLRFRLPAQRCTPSMLPCQRRANVPIAI
jgi:hypothetical protein